MYANMHNTNMLAAAFGRLCVETRISRDNIAIGAQPPSGGCVLKRGLCLCIGTAASAAFGRLCVETVWLSMEFSPRSQPPSGGCVLKQNHKEEFVRQFDSRLRAAVC